MVSIVSFCLISHSLVIDQSAVPTVALPENCRDLGAAFESELGEGAPEIGAIASTQNALRAQPLPNHHVTLIHAAEHGSTTKNNDTWRKFRLTC
jgi:hypothetical protein